MSFPQKFAFGGGRSAFEPVIPQSILTAAFAASKASAQATRIDLVLCHSGASRQRKSQNLDQQPLDSGSRRADPE
jgi:hypothetical protein